MPINKVDFLFYPRCNYLAINPIPPSPTRSFQECALCQETVVLRRWENITGNLVLKTELKT